MNKEEPLQPGHPKDPIKIGDALWACDGGELQYSNAELNVRRRNGDTSWYRIDTHANNRPINKVHKWGTHTLMHGRRHRDDGPALELADGTKEWWVDGEIQRSELPDGSKFWFRRGAFHRVGGPAAISAGGQELWYRNGRLHRENGPALTEKGGAQSFLLFGERVDRKVVMEPESLTRDEIGAFVTSPILNYLLHRLGKTFLDITRAEEVERWKMVKSALTMLGLRKNSDGILWEARLGERHHEVRIRIVEVVNGTPEADGSYRHYFLRVPHEMQGASQAVAWTYGLTAAEYKNVRIRT